ncbi:uncharacterized protein LOC142825643 [Pelodiscus sinensis]|uniref:uncharacterized protein LOC142825643 n=1 Tax=Pelodiscus sinensis TaxID=13735 RepID=UPI003F6B3B97
MGLAWGQLARQGRLWGRDGPPAGGRLGLMWPAQALPPLEGVAVDKRAAEKDSPAGPLSPRPGPYAERQRPKEPHARHKAAASSKVPPGKSAPQGSRAAPPAESWPRARRNSLQLASTAQPQAERRPPGTRASGSAGRLGAEWPAGRSALHVGRKELHTKLTLVPRDAGRKGAPAGRNPAHDRRHGAQAPDPGWDALLAGWAVRPSGERWLLLRGASWRPGASRVPARPEQGFGTACLTRVTLLVGETPLPSAASLLPRGASRWPGQAPGRAALLQSGAAPGRGHGSWLRGGTRWLWEGVNKLPSGTSQLLDAISQLQGGVSQLPCQVSPLPDIAPRASPLPASGRPEPSACLPSPSPSQRPSGEESTRGKPGLAPGPAAGQ